MGTTLSDKILEIIGAGEKNPAQIVDESNGSIKLGSVHATLQRMEERGLVKSRKVARTPPAIGEALRFYRKVGIHSAHVDAIDVSDLEATLIGIVRTLQTTRGKAQCYSLPINQMLTELRRGRPITLGALYTALERLFQKGLLNEELIPAEPRRGGRGKRAYGVTEEGLRAFDDWCARVQRVLDLR